MASKPATGDEAGAPAEEPEELPQEVKPTEHAPFVHLASCLEQGLLSQEQVEELKQKFEHLHEVVCGTLDNEKALLAKARELNKTVASRRTIAEKKQAELAEVAAGIATSKKELEERNVAMQEVEQNVDLVSMRHDALVAEKEELAKELAEKRATHMKELEPMLTKLSTEIADLDKEIEKLAEEEKTLTEQSADYVERTEQCKIDLETLERMKGRKRQQMSKMKAEPERIKVQTEVAARAAKTLQKECTKLEEKLVQQDKDIQALNTEKKRIDNQRYVFAEKLMRLRDAMEKKERDSAEITRRLDLAKQKTHEHEEMRMQLTVEMAECREHLRNETDVVARYNKHIEDLKKKYERLRRNKEQIEILPVREEHDRSSRKLQDMQAEVVRQKNQIVELKQDVDIFISTFLQEESKESEVRKKLEKKKESIGALEKQMAEERETERELQAVIRDLTSKREGLARDSAKLNTQFKEAKKQLKVRDLVVMDLKKKHKTLIFSLKQCRKMYEIIKNARNKYANLTQSSYQALAEMREKIKIVQNEVEILRNESLSKDRALVEEARILQTAQYTRDSLRLEQMKANQALSEKKELARRYVMDISKLQLIIRSADEEMKRLRSQYTEAVKDRNATGVQLIDRNDELCILYEKKNILEGILKKGDEQIVEQEEASKSFELEVKQLCRRLEVGKLQTPSMEEQKATARRYSEVQRGLQDERKLVTRLSEQLEVPNPELNPKRYRKISGNDPDEEQLTSQIAVLSSRLNGQKERILEKELVLEEVTSLSNKLRLQAAEGHQTTLELAKQMNEWQTRIKKLTRKMMACVSELSIFQATAIRLEREKDTMEHVLYQGEQNMKEGVAPNEEAEHEWNKMEHVRLLREAAMARPLHPSVQKPIDPNLPCGQAPTTCSPRPNAYIPDEIGIPKPYGAHAPFKPTESAAERRIARPHTRPVRL